MIAGAGSRSSRGRRSFTKRGGGCCCFFFSLYEWRAAATAAAGSAARAVPPPSLREEVKATFTPLRTWVGTVRVAGGGVVVGVEIGVEGEGFPQVILRSVWKGR